MHSRNLEPFWREKPNTKAQITVIIVNYNSGRYIRSCLEALSNQEFADFQAVVVDNASTDDSLSLCQGFDERFSFVPLRRNLGFAAANNLVAFATTSPWIATLNPDAIPTDRWLSQLVAAVSRYAGVAMFGSTQIKDSTRLTLDGVGDVYSFCGMVWRGYHNHPLSDLPEDGEVFSPCAAAALYRADVFRLAGGFDERFFCYCEDLDLAFRIRLLGHRCIQVRDAEVYHVGSESSGRHSDFAVYHGFRNRLWTYVKDMPSPLFQLLLFPHLAATLCHIFYEAAQGRGKPAWKGVRDAILGLSKMWASRSLIQRSRRESVIGIARAMCWSPLKILARAHDLRPPKEKGPMGASG